MEETKEFLLFAAALISIPIGVWFIVRIAAKAWYKSKNEAFRELMLFSTEDNKGDDDAQR